MNNKYLALFKDTLIFAIGSMGSKLILFFLVPLYTNCLTTEEYGIAELVFTLGQLLSPVFILSINDALLRFGLMKDSKRENVLMNGVWVFVVSIVITALITPAFRFYLAVSQWRWYLCLFVITSAAATLFTSYLKVKNQNKMFAVVSIIQTAVLAFLNIYLLAFLHIGVEGYLIANIVSNIAAFLVSIIGANVFKDLSISKFDKILLKQMVLYSSPMILNNISWWIIHSSDKIMVEYMLDASALGLFTVATKIPALINVIIAVFTQAWGISSIKEIESSNDKKYYSNVFSVYSFLTFGAAVVLISIIKPFMNIYVGDQFKDGWVFVPLLLVSAVFSSVSAYYGALFAALKNSLANMKSSLIAALVNIFVNYFGILFFGVWGAVIGTVVAYVTIALIRMYGVNKQLNIKVDYFRFLSNIFISLVMAIFVSCNYHILLVSIVSVVLFMIINVKQFVLLVDSAKRIFTEKFKAKK